MTEAEIKETCGNCAYYYDCYNDSFDMEWAKKCYNIKDDNIADYWECED